MVPILIGVNVNGLKSFHNKDERVMKYQLSNNLWSSYQKTMFKLAKLPDLKDNLAILTAYNPWGLPASTAENIYSNRELAHVLEAKAIELIDKKSQRETIAMGAFIERTRIIAKGV